MNTPDNAPTTPTTITRAAYVSAALTYLGVPWRHLGRSHGGIDCVGLIVASASDCGVTLLQPGDYRLWSKGAEFLPHLKAALTPGGPLPSNGSILALRASIYPCHLAIYVRNANYPIPMIVHANATQKKVTLESYASWARNVVGVWEIPGIK